MRHMAECFSAKDTKIIHQKVLKQLLTKYTVYEEKAQSRVQFGSLPKNIENL
jgi:hypothetical protein